MAFGDGVFRARAASLLRSSTPSASHSLPAEAIQEKILKTSVENLPDQKRQQNPAQTESKISKNESSGGQKHHSSDDDDNVPRNREAQRVRTIPGQSLLSRV